MRLLVCGSRTYGREVLANGDLGLEIPALGLVFDVLQGVYEQHSMGFLLTHMEHFTVVEGGARGADTHASMWAGAVGPHPGDVRDKDPDMCSVLHETYPAKWDEYGRKAGPIRNQEMLDTGIDLCLAFVDKAIESSKGTYDMVTRAWRERVPTHIIEKLAWTPPG